MYRLQPGVVVLSEVQSTNEITNRRTFAIISHPDAGKTTITEKLLLLGRAIQMAGTVKSKKSDRYATSEWRRSGEYLSQRL